MASTERTKGRTRHVVARVDDVVPGQAHMIRLKGRSIGIFNLDGEYFALLDRCPHQGAALCRGRLTHLVESERAGVVRVSRRGEFIKCPWHGWEFDIRTGQSWCDPDSMYVRQFGIRVEPGETLVKGPYVAETFPVTTEGEYLVIEM